MSATWWYALGKWQQWLNDLILNGRTCKTPLWSFKVHTEITCVQWFYQPLVCDPNKWWHVSVRVTYSGRVQELNQTVHRCDIERELFHYMALVWYWFFVLCCMWPCMLHVCCVPSLLLQTISAVSLAPQSTMPCVALGVSWAAASHTQQWYPSTLSSAVCRFVWKLNLMAATNSQKLLQSLSPNSSSMSA